MPDDEEVTRRMADPMREPIFINLTVRVDNFVLAFARFRHGETARPLTL
jgi:hypothetical protein